MSESYAPAAERFWAKVDKTGPCWVWTGSLASSGYGRFWFGGRLVQAHRWAYEALRGPLDPALVLDHLCRNRACVNPEHAEPVTHRENILRGRGATAQKARQGRCHRGHEFTPDNIYRSPSRPNARICRACQRERIRDVATECLAPALLDGDSEGRES